MPKVSVIIGSYNAEKYIEETIRSVLNQTYKDYELIVIDDGSSDNTVKIIEQLLSPPHKLVAQKNAGEAAARNHGLKIANGEYIAFLDHDDLFHPKKLEKTVDFLDNNSEYGMVYGNYSYIIEPGSNSIWSNWGFIRGAYKSGDIFIDQFIQNKIHIITTLIRRECFNKVGFFDKTMNYASDSDMWIRISADYKIGYIDEVFAYYRLHNTNVSLDRETCLKHRIASMKKNYSMFYDRVKGNNEIISSIKNLYYRLIKNYVKSCDFKEAYKWFKDYRKFMKEW